MNFFVSGLFHNDNISKKINEIINGKKILEIGGPSPNNYWIPKFYEISLYTDIINFSDQNNISLELGCKEKLNDNLKYRKIYKLNIDDTYEYINFIEKDYDIILTCHCLEHQANPIKQLLLWKKLLKKGGIIINILPEKSLTLDCNRPITKFSKIIQKYEDNIEEDDITEIDEMILYKNTNPDKISGITNICALEDLKNNPSNIKKYRPLHQHVYDFNLLKNISNFINMKQFMEFNIYLDNWVFWIDNE